MKLPLLAGLLAAPAFVCLLAASPTPSREAHQMKVMLPVSSNPSCECLGVSSFTGDLSVDATWINAQGKLVAITIARLEPIPNAPTPGRCYSLPLCKETARACEMSTDVTVIVTHMGNHPGNNYWFNGTQCTLGAPQPVSFASSVACGITDPDQTYEFYPQNQTTVTASGTPVAVTNQNRWTWKAECQHCPSTGGGQ